MKHKGKKKRSMIRELITWVIYLVVLCSVAYLVTHFIGERTEVKGESMAPALSDGDNLIVDKISYRFTDPDRFDIIVFPFKYQEDTFYIKRIIGLPGETVQIFEGEIYINGKKLKENFSTELIRNPGLASDAVTLGEHEYFVLGDNRNNSTDSREPSVGNVSKDEIIGKAWLRIWPFEDIAILRHQ